MHILTRFFPTQCLYILWGKQLLTSHINCCICYTFVDYYDILIDGTYLIDRMYFVFFPLEDTTSCLLAWLLQTFL